MSIYLTAFVGLIYIAVAVIEWIAGRFGFSIMFVGYALANAGIIWSMMQ